MALGCMAVQSSRILSPVGQWTLHSGRMEGVLGKGTLLAKKWSLTQNVGVDEGVLSEMV